MVRSESGEERKQRGIQSVEVGARLLDALAARREPLALSALAEAAELSTAQAHTYLVSLTRLGLVKRDALTGNYEPGPLSLRLGLLNLEQQPAYRAAAPRVAALALATGMSVAVSVAGPQGPTIVRYERGGFPLHVNLHVGTVMSLSATSTGRVFRAFDDPTRVAAMLAHQAETDAPEMAAHIDEIRARGIERGVDAPSPGVSSMSVPVFDGAHRMQLALTAIGPTGLCDVAWDSLLARALQDAARDIAGRLS
ncbi:IclR family transcriptional regulator [Caballeronia ptereochthonis]|uniref:IclR family transcriptional regulator n=1 Tax=Caballeronia ptereochthonis TaxID=1777144 RepID=A0A158D2S4_9BURK|nr:helix-turn-helix domain-containing protein [Caballeronia ptereochthonis]SAK88912.1 IclR family transcriptional regulator [Caballeronia ptereochthonis]